VLKQGFRVAAKGLMAIDGAHGPCMDSLAAVASRSSSRRAWSASLEEQVGVREPIVEDVVAVGSDPGAWVRVEGASQRSLDLIDALAPRPLLRHRPTASGLRAPVDASFPRSLRTSSLTARGTVRRILPAAGEPVNQDKRVWRSRRSRARPALPRAQ